MPSDDIGINTRDLTVRGAPRGAPGSGTTPASRPLVPLQPVAPTSGAPAATAGSGPLGRSGVALLDLFDAPDVHVSREGAAPVAVEVALERARTALLRGSPVDALVSLDMVWDGAKRTEDGWYLRGGALFALGLPGEGDRLAQAGLALRSSSAALRFLQSLARLAIGDVAGARATLALALQQRPADLLLAAQDAVVLAHQGDHDGADGALRSLSRGASPDDPVLSYARDAVRVALANGMRAAAGGPGARPGVPGVQHWTGPVPVAEVLQAIDDAMPHAHDPLSGAMHKFGARVALLPPSDVATAARTLLRALSSGGVLAGSCHPGMAHAARRMIAAVLRALNDADAPRAAARGGPRDAPDGFANDSDCGNGDDLVTDVIDALRARRPDDAVRLVRRQPGAWRASSGALLEALVRGGLRGIQCAGAGAPTADDVTADLGAPPSLSQVQDDARGPIVPLRLGLRLLTESAADRAACLGNYEATTPDGSDLRTGAGDRRPDSYEAGIPPVLPERAWHGLDDPAVPLHALHNAQGAASHVALHHSMATRQRQQDRRQRKAPSAGTMAVACVILAACAAAFGYPVLAVAFGVGASWLAVRRIGAGAEPEASGDSPHNDGPDTTSASGEPADDTRHRR